MAIPDAVQEKMPQVPTEPHSLGGGSGQPKKKSWLWILIIIVLAGGGYYYYKSRPSAESKAAPAPGGEKPCVRSGFRGRGPGH